MASSCHGATIWRRAETEARLENPVLLLAQYDGRAIIPVQKVCADYFSHLSPSMFVRKRSAGEIKLPLVRMDTSQKRAKGARLQDLADYLDARRLQRQAVHQPTGLAQPAVRVAGRDEGAACDAVPAVPGYWMQTQLSSGLSTETGALDE